MYAIADAPDHAYAAANACANDDLYALTHADVNANFHCRCQLSTGRPRRPREKKPGASGKKAPLKRGRQSATLTGTGGVVIGKSRLPGSCKCRNQIVTGHEDTRRKTGFPSRRRGRSAPGAPD